MNDNVYILGVGIIKFGRFLERSVKDMAGLVLDDVLKDCDLTREDIEAAWFSNTCWGIFSSATALIRAGRRSSASSAVSSPRLAAWPPTSPAFHGSTVCRRCRFPTP